MARTLEASPSADGDAPVRPITVASVPAGHPYIRRISADPRVTVLPDPTPPGAAEGVWWPPVVLDPAWIAGHRDQAEILHVHFGTESFAPGHLSACVRAASDAGWSTVFTVHDLTNPQLSDQSAHDAQLDELVTSVDAVTTLTPGAAAAVESRWNRRALVIPHPSLLDPGTVVPPVRGSEDARVGVHLKDLRPSVDGPGSVRALIGAVARLRSRGIRAVAEVRMHHAVRDEAARAAVRELCADAAHTTLIEHERLSDAELTVALGRLDACVLPYRHGTHSGWLELCWDLGVPVAAPRIGFFAEQHPDDGVASFFPTDTPSLADALGELLTATQATRSGSPERARLLASRREGRRVSDARIASTHAELYRDLRARRRS